jgi:ribosomal protein S2
MKIQKIIKYKQKLIKLHIIKSKIYKKNQTEFTKLEHITSRLKKAMQIIYKYHINNKKILFIGGSKIKNHYNKYILKKTKHKIIPEFAWVDGLISNKNLKNNKNNLKNFALSYNQTKDLIVLLDVTKNTQALHESYSTGIPSISFNSSFINLLDTKSSYRIPGRFVFTKKVSRDTFFYSLLFATLKKGEKLKYAVQKKKIGINQDLNNF